MHDTPVPIRLESQPGLWPRLFSPLNVAAYITWMAVSFAVIDRSHLLAGDTRQWLGFSALLGILALFVLLILRDLRDVRWPATALVMLEGTLVVVADAALHHGQVSVLLIIVAGQLVMLAPPRVVFASLLVLNSALALQWIARTGSVVDTLAWMVPIIGFQAFAALTAHYAGSSERARMHLAEVNAELLATRRLLEESARAGERLKLSRELHDVAGHGLTALKLNLTRLARDPSLADREEVAIATMLADDLLHQIRQVVGTLRAHDGLDLRAALDALVHPIPGVRISLDIDPHLRVDDIEQASALLRCVQESITNALRHGRAGTISIRLKQTGDVVRLYVANDGDTPTDLRSGHGLTGMRERLEAAGGALEIVPTPPRGLEVRAIMPTRTHVGARVDTSASA